MRKHRALPTWRPLAPALFVLGVVLGPLWWQFDATRIAYIGAMATYAVIVLTTALVKSRVRLVVRTAAAIMIMHFAYGLGFLRGLAKMLLRREA